MFNIGDICHGHNIGKKTKGTIYRKYNVQHKRKQ